MSDASKTETDAKREGSTDGRTEDPLAGLTTLDWADAVEPEQTAASEPATGDGGTPKLAAEAQKSEGEPKREETRKPKAPEAKQAKDVEASIKTPAPVRKEPISTGSAPTLVATPQLDRAPRVGLAGDRGRTEPRGRGGLWTAAAAAAVACLVVAVAAATTGGPDDKASAKARDLEAKISQSEKRLAELDAERRKNEEALMQTQRDLNAKRGELAQAQERVDGIEKRRASLEKETGALTTKAASVERVPDEVQETPADDGPLPPPKTADAGAPGSVDTPNGSKPAASKSPNAAPKTASLGDDAGSKAPADREAAQAVRVFIHIQAGSPSARARGQAIAAELRRRGVSVAEIRQVPHAVRRDAVRYFYDEDRAALSTVERAVRDASPPDEAAPLTQDFRGFGAPPKPGTMEIWLS